MEEKLYELLRQKFKLQNFQDLQLEIITNILTQRDLFVLLKTSGGKSLCYQLSALYTDGLTIVISPLTSLIYDQVQKLRSLEIHTAILSGSLEEDSFIYHDLLLKKPVAKLVYITPEKLISSVTLLQRIVDCHKHNNLQRIIIDESHCVLEWGTTFRKSYLELEHLKSLFPEIQIVVFIDFKLNKHFIRLWDCFK